MDYPGGRSLAYELDAVGNRLQLTDPDSGITTYDYDPGNRLKEIHNPFSETTLISYDELNREKVKTLANGMTIHHTYDAGGRETLLQHKNSSGTVVAKYDSTVSGNFDAVGNRLKVRELDDSEVTFAYDCTYRLTSEVRTGSTPYTRSYEYDGTGNRTRKEEDGEVTLYHYGTGNRLMSQEPGGSSSSSSSSGSSSSGSSGSSSSSAGAGSGYIAYGYDANGNLLTSEEDGQITTYNWDDDDQLALVELPDSTYETCTYSDGLRRSKTVGGNTTHYIWDDDNLLQETNTSNVTQAQFTHDPDGWGGLSSQRRGGDSSFYGFDTQSNTRYLYNASEAASDSYVLSAFGKMEQQTGSTPNPHKFCGEVGYESEGSGLHYVRARYYDERSGRWISRDPIGFGGGDVNLYVYCGSNPIGETDPSGLQSGPGATYLGDVGRVFQGYGSFIKATVTSPVAIYNYYKARGISLGSTKDLAVGSVIGISRTAYDAIEHGNPKAFGEVWLFSVTAAASGVGAVNTVRANRTAAAAEAAATAAAGSRRIGATGATGATGEAALRRMGGGSQVALETRFGTRVVDQLVRGHAHEAKVGRVSLTRGLQGTRRQIAKDVQLIRTGQVRSVTWHFYRSPVTRRIGPTAPLARTLQRHGIQTVIHR